MKRLFKYIAMFAMVGSMLTSCDELIDGLGDEEDEDEFIEDDEIFDGDAVGTYIIKSINEDDGDCIYTFEYNEDGTISKITLTEEGDDDTITFSYDTTITETRTFGLATSIVYSIDSSGCITSAATNCVDYGTIPFYYSGDYLDERSTTYTYSWSGGELRKATYSSNGFSTYSEMTYGDVTNNTNLDINPLIFMTEAAYTSYNVVTYMAMGGYTGAPTSSAFVIEDKSTTEGQVDTKSYEYTWASTGVPLKISVYDDEDGLYATYKFTYYTASDN